MSQQMDFTTGPLFRKMIWFAWPTFLANLLQSSYQFIDSLWIGNLIGSEAIGAVAISSPVLFSVLSFMIGINGATLTVLSQYKGKKDQEGLFRSLNAFAYVLSILSIVLGFSGFVLAPSILTWLGTPALLLEDAILYLRIHFVGILFLMGYNFVSTVLRAVGDSKTPVRFVLLALVLNIVLDPILIAWLDLDIAGAAYASVISQGSAFIYGIVFSSKKRSLPFKLPTIPDRQHIMQVLSLGIPGGLQMVAISSGMVAIMHVISQFGSEVVSGIGAAQRIESLMMIPAMTMGSVVNSMAGQNIGAQVWQRVHRIARQGLALIVVVSITLGIIIYVSADLIIMWFLSDQKTAQFGVDYLRTISLFIPFLGINFVLNGIARSSGAMLQVLILNLISFWLLRLPLTALCSDWFGSSGIALGIGYSFIFSSIFSVAYYVYGGWKRIRITGKRT